MKIIKHGKVPTQVTCHNCDCEFIYEPSDIKSDSDWISEGNGGNSDVYDCRECFPELAKKYKTVLAVGWRYYRESYVTCPECGEYISINDSYAFCDATSVLVSNRDIDIDDPDIYDRVLDYGCSSHIGGTVMANVVAIMGDGKVHKQNLPVSVITYQGLRDILQDPTIKAPYEK